MSTKDPNKKNRPIHSPKGKDFAGMAEQFTAGAESFHKHAEQFAGSAENTSAEMVASAETLVAAAKKFPEGTAEFPAAEQSKIVNSAEMVASGAEMLHAEATPMSAEHAESAEHLLAGSSEMMASAEHGAESLVPSAETLATGAEAFATAETPTAPLDCDGSSELFNSGSNRLRMASDWIVSDYLIAGGANGKGSYYGDVGVFMEGAEEMLDSAEALSALSAESIACYPDFQADVERLKNASNFLTTAQNFPQQEKGVKIINDGLTELFKAIDAKGDLVPAAEMVFQGAEVYVNINEDSVEEFNTGGAEINSSAAEYSGGNLSSAEETLLFGAEQVQLSSGSFRYILPASGGGAEAGESGEEFVIGGSNDLAELYVGSAEDLTESSELILETCGDLTKLATNDVAEAGVAEMTSGAEALIAESLDTTGGEEASGLLSAAGAEVLAGAEEYVKGMAETAPAA